MACGGQVNLMVRRPRRGAAAARRWLCGVCCCCRVVVRLDSRQCVQNCDTCTPASCVQNCYTCASIHLTRVQAIHGVKFTAKLSAMVKVSVTTSAESPTLPPSPFHPNTLHPQPIP